MTKTSRKQFGFSLLEALIALLVMSFGMLALASMQLSLSRSADVAKQRTEAMRLAQERIETLRSFVSSAAWDALANGSDTATANTNTTYTRTWTFGGTITETMRPIQVMVTWNDRSGTADYVTLSSVISRTDPADSGFLGFPLPQNINLKRPKNRNINIPIAASALPGGKSAYQLAAGVTIVFSDLSGGVIERCTGTVNATSYTNNTAGCAVFTAYILAGYV